MSKGFLAPKPKQFDASSDPRRSNYLAQYNNPNTSADRRAAIDKTWHFSGGGAPGGSGGEMSTQPLYNTKDVDYSKYNLNTPGGISKAQQAANDLSVQQGMQANRVGQQSDYGSSQYVKNPDGSYTRVEQLSPDQQRILQSRQGVSLGANTMAGGLLGQVANNYAQPLSYDGAPKLPGDATQFNQDVVDKIYNPNKARLDQDWAQREQAARQNLADRGIAFGSDAYNSSMRQFSQDRNDAYNQALSSATSQGVQSGQQIYNSQLAGHQQGIKDINELRNSPLTEIQNLLGQSQDVKDPNFAPISDVKVSPTDVTTPADATNTNTSQQIIGAGHDKAQVGAAGLNANASILGMKIKLAGDAGIAAGQEATQKEIAAQNAATSTNNANISANASQPSWQSTAGNVLGAAVGGFAQGAGSSKGRGR